jgi:hypothetical protein
MNDKPELKIVKPDVDDLVGLWLDTGLGDGLTETHIHSIPIKKPVNYFRTCPLLEFRRKCEIYVHKIEEQIEEETYLIDEGMRGIIDEARPATLVTVVYRDGTLRLWALKLPKDGEKDNEAWRTARVAARTAMEKWVKLVWKRSCYQTRDAQPGYAPDPDYSKLPPFNELVRTACGEHGIIRDRNHPIVRNLFGAPEKPDGGDDGLS